MSILSGHNLAKYFGAQDVFAGVGFDIARGDKVALVGPNGAGKTTLLRIILGMEEPTEGDVFRSRSLQIGYLPQQSTFPSDRKLHEEMLTVYDDLRRQQRNLQVLLDEMAAVGHDDDLLERYAKAEARFEVEGGYEYENRISQVLSGLGFGPETYDWPITMLSGGQITRALLAKLLLQMPELLILDEPTNYLDLDALEWLEAYLQSWPHSLLIVSHDRYFLDSVVSRVWEMNHGRLETYRGNYSHYVEQREARRQRQATEFERQQAEIAKTEEFIRRYKAGQRSKEARGRLTRLERLERIERPENDRHMHLRLDPKHRSGNDVIISDGVSVGYPTPPDDAVDSDGPHLLFRTGDILVRRGARVALLGANGCGKTTLIRTMLGEMEPLGGRLRLGASLRVGYLPQKQDWLEPSKSVLDHIVDASGMLVGDARSFLGRFIFSGDDVFKLVETLSGGERARLALALLTLDGANLLILDEPTTHLDVASQEILQQVLTDFPGTILFVSHDRYLINALATHVWVVRDGFMHQYEGNYAAYLVARQEEREAEQLARAASSSELNDYEETRQARREAQRQARRLQDLEGEIGKIERRLEELTDIIDLASAAQDVARVHELGTEYTQLKADLATHLHEWESLATEVESGAS